MGFITVISVDGKGLEKDAVEMGSKLVMHTEVSECFLEFVDERVPVQQLQR